MKLYFYKNKQYSAILPGLVWVLVGLLLAGCGDTTATSTSLPTTAATVAAVATTAAPTTAAATTSAATTAAPTTVAATTAVPTTQVATTSAPTTVAATTAAPTTVAAKTAAPPTPVAKINPANDVQAAQLIKLMNGLDQLKESIDFAVEGSAKLSDFQKYVNQALTQGATAKTNLAAAMTAFGSDPAAMARLKEIESHIDAAISAGQKAVGATELNAGIQTAVPLASEGKEKAYPKTLALLVDSGVTGTISGLVTDNAGKPMPDSYISIYSGPVFQMGKTDATGNFSFNKAPAFTAVQVKAYQEGFIYHEEKVPLQRGGQAKVTIRLPKMPDPSKAPTASKPTIKADVANPRLLTFSLTATDPQNDVSEQVYAINLNLGIGVVLFPKGDNLWAENYTLPENAPKTSDWVFFAVDRQCNQGSFLTTNYNLP